MGVPNKRIETNLGHDPFIMRRKSKHNSCGRPFLSAAAAHPQRWVNSL